MRSGTTAALSLGTTASEGVQSVVAPDSKTRLRLETPRSTMREPKGTGNSAARALRQGCAREVAIQDVRESSVGYESQWLRVPCETN